MYLQRKVMITQEEFDKAISQFDKVEGRQNFYDMAVGLFNSGFEIEAYFLILATWNFASFRYAVKGFDFDGFKKRIMGLNPHFGKLQNQEFRTINFDRYAEDIKTIYDDLSSMRGVGHTGASKIMHLKNRNVFIMWDGYIKGAKPRKYYSELEIVKKGSWKIKKYGNKARDYLQFLKDMQELFKGITFHDNEKTFAKAVDEFNYVNITLPIQGQRKARSTKRKSRRQTRLKSNDESSTSGRS